MRYLRFVTTKAWLQKLRRKNNSSYVLIWKTMSCANVLALLLLRTNKIGMAEQVHNESMAETRVHDND
jgi:hypothetical protein